ncbi:Lar family restriction alleviation protein [Stenotrophomonas sp. GD03908]|uniref:Lar family restriction alleviation protein n=1 Tax=Stenotrophomonas maltophilia TaxID=40324 RepID=A0AAJ2TP97_STEMA|nr:MULTISPECIES: Lar family restriction alleviation protein [Stenotrophomonas]MBH1480876.1 Lar family restriction alleviation protein [Stenotrophomonas maltophilia]MDH0978801.1 Lar family restriction alleviation protein [Stenotrophomonas sp. GD03908]MDQ7294207.1 Lar family restriction alleviation protein [Stenotrophomonas sp. Sm0041]MDZ5764916.1 Lar family restriction alleviation protein [Stenotrophomonas maltophilia]
MTAPALKPCPWCGREPSVMASRSGIGFLIMCDAALDECPATPAVDEGSMEKASRAWNKRASRWKPISDAPQDGTRLMLWDSVSKRSVFGSWRGDNPKITHYDAEPACPERD